MDHACPGSPAARAGVLEEGKVGAGAALLVRVEKVVDGRVVLVHGLLDQAQAHHTHVELEVFGRVPGDRADVVDAVELFHDLSLQLKAYPLLFRP